MALNRPREELVAKLESGMSVGVNINGSQVQITKVEDLPSEAELAAGDPRREGAARADIIRQRAELDAQMAILEGEEASRSIATPTGSTTNDSTPPANTTPPAPNDGVADAPSTTSPPADATASSTPPAETTKTTKTAK